jgi:cation diffusion facilitator CzcD-associated flavoprotein CzcO
MEEIRARCDEVVADPKTAEALKAWYRQLCKRPCFHDEYLAAFNQPSVRLIDTDGQGVERITPGGVVAAGVEYPVDCIIYASGFEVGTEPIRRYGFDLTGRDGVRLSDYWSAGMRTLHGIHVHGFPNAFIVQLGQGANFLPNVPHNLTDSARTVAAIVAHMAGTGLDVVEVTREAEDEWMEQLAPNPVMMSFLSECTPGYYNNEGQDPGPHSRSAGYPKGPAAYFRYIDAWRRSGEFAGLEFSPAHALAGGRGAPGGEPSSEGAG